MIAEPQTLAPVRGLSNWTAEAVAALDDEVRRELYDGKIFEMPSPTLIHQNIILNLAFLFKIWAQTHGGRAFLSPFDLFVSATRSYIPDLCFFTAENLANNCVLDDPRRVYVSPDVIVEVLSDSTARNDRIAKTGAYAEFGVPNYWIVDPAARTLEAFALRDGLYVLVAALDETQNFTPAAFEELSIPLGQVFDI